MPRSTSAVSMPVTPSTPGAAAQTLRSLSETSCGRQPSMWRVTSTRSTVRGPSASGVTVRLPSPATSTVRHASGSIPAIARPSASLSARRVPSSMLMRCGQLSVT